MNEIPPVKKEIVTFTFANGPTVEEKEFPRKPKPGEPWNESNILWILDYFDKHRDEDGEIELTLDEYMEFLDNLMRDWYLENEERTGMTSPEYQQKLIKFFVLRYYDKGVKVHWADIKADGEGEFFKKWFLATTIEYEQGTLKGYVADHWDE